MRFFLFGERNLANRDKFGGKRKLKLSVIRFKRFRIFNSIFV